MGPNNSYNDNRIRFPAPVPAGSRVRAKAEVVEVEEVGGGWHQVVTRFTLEVEGNEKPCFVGESVTRSCLPTDLPVATPSSMAWGGPFCTLAAVNRTRVLNSLIVSRMTFGVVVWAFPGPVGRAFGFDMTRNPQAPYLARLVGARDVALAWGLIATEGDAQRQWLLAGLACDSADTLAAIAGGVSGLSKRTTAMLLAAALAPMVRGAIALNAREQ